MYSRPSESKPRSSLKNRVLELAYQSGLIRAGRGLWARSLTVVNYHRIEDPQRGDFDSFKPNVSATPESFARQMDYLSRWFHVVSLKEVVAWLDGGAELPPYAALITFDDGYLDNYTAAFPILRERRLPALIFLATGHIDTDTPFHWDLSAYLFAHTRRQRVTFPDGHVESWSNPQERERVSRRWTESMKALPETEKQARVEGLSGELGMSVPQGYFRNLMMSWDHVREMHRSGIEFGAHTVSHPILTRIPLEHARAEVEGSKLRIERELGEPVLGFAYPNGFSADVNGQIEQIVAQAGFRTAFTLLNGPSPLSEVKRNPFAVRRVFISHRHSLAEYAMLLSPLNRYRSN